MPKECDLAQMTEVEDQPEHRRMIDDAHQRQSKLRGAQVQPRESRSQGSLPWGNFRFIGLLTLARTMPVSRIARRYGAAVASRFIFVVRSTQKSTTATPIRTSLAAELGRTPVIAGDGHRSEEHTSELQSHLNLVCR